MKRKTLILGIVLALFVSLFSAACATQSVSVTIDGQAVSFTKDSGTPFIDENARTLVPLRIVMEQYGCTVGWDAGTKTAAVTLGDATVTITVGQKQIFVNGTAQAIDAPAQIANGRTYLPIRSVLEAFGATVGWNGQSRTVTVFRPVRARVHFIDVGQADCILITSNDEAMLIDAGNNDDDTIIINYLQSCGITKLKYAVGTHPHEDHIGALDDVIKNLEVDNVLMPKIAANTATFEDVLDAISQKGLQITAPQAGDTYSVGDAMLTSVGSYLGDDLNNASIMLRMTCGEVSFLFTADAEAEAEEAALATGLVLKSDVLKVGHHGSRTSSSPAFLSAVAPDHAVITCGKDNDYGHPHAETMDSLSSLGCAVYRTDEMGTVVASTDGESIVWSTPGEIAEAPAAETGYILNTKSMKFHLPTCGGVKTMSPQNKKESNQTRQQLLDAGYSPCGSCSP